MAKNKLIYSKRTKPWDYSFHVIIKQHHNKRILYVTYGGGKKTGGGAWSENLNNVHPRTISMIENYLGQRTVDEIATFLQDEPRRGNSRKSK